jgi:two-component system, NarL family, response regulator
MSKRGVIRVLIADDHPVVCMGLAAMITTQPDMEVVAQVSDGFEAIQVFNQHKPDIVLMDLRMPNCGGVEAIRTIRESNPTARFMVLTTYQGDEDIHRALTAGAQAYLLKGMPYGELLRAIRDVHSGIRYLPPAVEKTLAGRPPDELSTRELEVLRLIAKGFSNRQIANELGITEGTVKWHVNIILSRLHVTDRTQAVVAAVQRGIVDLNVE